MSDIQTAIANLKSLEGKGTEPGSEAQSTTEWPDILRDQKTLDALTAFLQTEIEDERDGAGRSELKERWKTYRRMRKSTPEQAERNWPWKRASNVEPPVTQQKIQTVTSKLNAAFGMKKPPVQVEAMNDVDYRTAQALEKYLGYLADNPSGMALQSKRRNIHYDQVSLGTAPVYVAFVDETRNFKRLDAGAEGGATTYQARYIGPALINVRLEDFLTRAHWTDLQRAPWFALEYRYYYHEILQRQQQNFFRNAQQIIDKSLERYDDAFLQELSDKGITVGDLAKDLETRLYRVYLVHVLWDVDDDGVPEDLIVWFHPETRTILRCDYNSIGKRTITLFGYMEEPDLIYSMGMCEILESMQKEITALHRMRIDGVELSMLKVWLTRRGSGLNPDEELSPFKVLEVDDILNDVKVLDFQDPSQSCLLSESVARDYADKVSGASDIMSGFYDPVAKSGQNASSTLALLQAGNSIMNSVLETNELAWNDVWQNVVYQLVANQDQLDFQMLPADEAALLTAFFKSVKVEDLPTKFRFKVRVTDINQTGDSKRQMTLAANQLYFVYAEKAMALFGMIQQVRQAMAQAQAGGVDPQTGAAMPPNPAALQTLQAQLGIMLKFYIGYTEMLKEVFMTFDIESPTRFLPDLKREEAEIGQYGATNGDSGSGTQAGPGAGGTGIGPEPGPGPGSEPGIGGAPVEAVPAAQGPGGNPGVAVVPGPGRVQ